MGAAVRKHYRLRKPGAAIVRELWAPPTDAALIRRITREHALDPRLAPTDRHMTRWAASQGSDLPLDPARADSLPRTRLPPLSPTEAVVTDQIVLRSPDHWQRFIVAWYRSPKPTEVIAEEIGVSLRQVFDERRLVLAYLLGRLHEAGLIVATFVRW